MPSQRLYVRLMAVTERKPKPKTSGPKTRTPRRGDRIKGGYVVQGVASDGTIILQPRHGRRQFTDEQLSAAVRAAKKELALED